MALSNDQPSTPSNPSFRLQLHRSATTATTARISPGDCGLARSADASAPSSSAETRWESLRTLLRRTAFRQAASVSMEHAAAPRTKRQAGDGVRAGVHVDQEHVNEQEGKRCSNGALALFAWYRPSALVAQLVERLSEVQEAVGSIPSVCTKWQLWYAVDVFVAQLVRAPRC